MMMSPGSYIAQYKDSSIHALSKARRELLSEISGLQQSMCYSISPVYDIEPAPSLRISLLVEYLQLMDLLIDKRKAKKHASRSDVLNNLAYLNISFYACDDSTFKDSQIESWACFLPSRHSKSFNCLHTVYGHYPEYDDELLLGSINRNEFRDLLISLGICDWEEEYYSPILDGVGWSLVAIGSEGNFQCGGLNAFAPAYNQLTEFLTTICSSQA